MPICELCGKRTDKLFKVIIEGTVMNVCEDCVRYGKLVSEKRKTISIPTKEIVEKEYEIVEDYYEKVKKARETLGLTQEQFAKKYNIKLSVLKRIESGDLIPSLKLARKLEKILKIKLVEEINYHYQLGESEKKEREITLGDIVELK